MVVTTGVVTSSVKVSGRKSKPLWMMSKSLLHSNTAEMCRHSATLGSMVGSSDQPVATTDRNLAAVIESPVANRVTSCPRATRPSDSSEANSSQGP